MPTTLKTALSWWYRGAPRLLALTWACDDERPDGSRIAAALPMEAAGPQPIGVALACVAVSAGLAGGLSLTAIVEACGRVDALIAGAPLGGHRVTASDSVGALARALIQAEAGGGTAARYALDCGPEPTDEEGRP